MSEETRDRPSSDDEILGPPTETADSARGDRRVVPVPESIGRYRILGKLGEAPLVRIVAQGTPRSLRRRTVPIHHGSDQAFVEGAPLGGRDPAVAVERVALGVRDRVAVASASHATMVSSSAAVDVGCRGS